MNYNLAQPFYDQSQNRPHKLALSVGNESFSYSALREVVQPIARWLQTRSGGSVGRVGILASRSVEAFSGILGTCWAGGTYVPLSTKLPEHRLVQQLRQIDLQALIVDRASLAPLADSVLRACPTYIISPAWQESESKPRADHVVHGAESLPAFDPNDRPVNIAADHTAYIEFTSGTTGVPKGVMIPTGGVAHFVKVMRERYEIGPEDRVAGVAETTFDISVFDMFMTWSCGACLCVVPATQVMAPIQTIQQNGITVVFTVPSVAVCMNRMKFLAPGSMAGLRYSLFSGEPLPVAAALAWRSAAPNSVLDNLYGPTEATVVCTGQRFGAASDATPGRGVVAIGAAFPGMQVAIVDSALQSTANGQPGEIVISGPQLSSGYFGDPSQTFQRYPTLAGNRWYRTGDLGYRDESGTLHHLGRIDNQVKVRGMRVELEEVEAHLREVYRTDSVAAVAWPIEHGSAAGIVAFVGGQVPASDSTQRALLKDRLPSYMIPTAIRHVDSLPLNANGKVNRRELMALLSAETA